MATVEEVSAALEPYRARRAFGLAMVDERRASDVLTFCQPPAPGHAAECHGVLGDCRGHRYRLPGSAWHRSRASSLGVQTAERMAHCLDTRGEFYRLTTDETATMEGGCNQPLCPRCQKRRQVRVREWLGRVVAAHHAVQTEAGRSVVMLTCSVRHSGDVVADVAALAAAWPRFRAAWLGREHFSFTYFRAEECPPGDHGQGHAHWHVVTWFPAFVDYEWLQEQWFRCLGYYFQGVQADCAPCCTRAAPCKAHKATPRKKRYPLCTGERPCSHHAPGTLHVERKQASADPAKAMAYVSKAFGYATKFASELAGFDAEALARYLDARYGKRRITASRGFWAIVPRPPSEWQIVTLERGSLPKPDPLWFMPVLDRS